MPTVSILIASYAKDRNWLEYNLRSIRKFATGFKDVTLVVPEQDKVSFTELAAIYKTKDLPIIVKTYVVAQGKGFNHHQAMKCHADILCPDSDMILHTDSDCMFTEPVTPEDYLIDRRPVLLKQSYSDIANKQDASLHWQEQTERALGCKVEYEYMRRHPAIHHFDVYKGLRDLVEEIHAMPFTDYVLKQKNTALQGFSEFNALGAYADRHRKGRYHWIDVTTDPRPADKLIQFWSWEPRGTIVKKAQMEKILK